ncbi:hypothetical protein ACIOJE_35140 [Kitasatospora sp. NPDC087861]|uniref:hypothetical protein n=1 Tax=Kitasatospora sp. NPDC087861 TaxID=3364070 RepID=UPI00382FA236
MTTTTPSYRVGDPTGDCRYPVYVIDPRTGTEALAGIAQRWGRDWLTTTSNGVKNHGRPDEGVPGIQVPAQYIATEYAAGNTTPLHSAQLAEEDLTQPQGDVPLLHPRVPQTPRNAKAAQDADTTMARYYWLRIGGFPGSDNPQATKCLLCGWTGWRYYSHLRGRNGNPPSANRHPGTCIDKARIRQLIPGTK